MKREIKVLFLKLGSSRSMVDNLGNDGLIGEKDDYEVVFGGQIDHFPHQPLSVLCDIMFRHCQNIEGPWCQPPHRSMMVGDLVQIGDDFFKCQMAGWAEVISFSRSAS